MWYTKYVWTFLKKKIFFSTETSATQKHCVVSRNITVKRAVASRRPRKGRQMTQPGWICVMRRNQTTGHNWFAFEPHLHAALGVNYLPQQ
jgi:hypothetical protein